jgi:hypothetical protein
MIGWRDYVRWQGMTHMSDPAVRGLRSVVAGCIDCRYAVASGLEGHWRCACPVDAGRGRAVVPEAACDYFHARR